VGDAGIYYDSGPRSIEDHRDGKNSIPRWTITDEVTIVCMQWWERERSMVADEQSQEMVEMSEEISDAGPYAQVGLASSALTV